MGVAKAHPRIAGVTVEHHSTLPDGAVIKE